jgi:hypothetical protein
MVQTHFSTTQGQADSQGTLGDRCAHGLSVGAKQLDSTDLETDDTGSR